MSIAIYSICAMTLPLLLIGFIQKIKAKLQNRIGAPLLQPFYNTFKLLNKGQILSEDASFIFRLGILINFCLATYLIYSVAWLNFAPVLRDMDIFFFVYILATARFFSILSALDTGSPFGAFGGSREATLAFLVEPAMVLCLVAPCILYGSSSISQIFSFSSNQSQSVQNPMVWIFASAGLFLVGLVELSRMPIDDPATHLELTMVHEAMTLEASGRSLALSEIAYSFKLVIFLGLVVQCALHSIYFLLPKNEWIIFGMSVVGIFVLALLVATLETVLVKLKWNRCSDFIAYAITMGLFACIAALAGRV